MSGLFKAVLAALLFAPAAAVAADLPMEAAAPAVAVPSFSWTGPYLGIQGDYHFGRPNQRGCTGICPTKHINKPFLAAVAGYDYQFSNNLVIGAMGGAGLTRIREHAKLFGPFDLKGKTLYGGFVGGRVGYAIDRLLPYGFVGYTFGKLKVHNEVTNITNRRSQHGVSLGAGIEYAVTDNISVDARYTYSHMSKRPYNFGGGKEYYGENASTISLGVNYRFNGF